MADSFAVQLGKRLRAARAGAGLSLAQVQERSRGRWTAGKVSSYERGDRNITTESLVGLAGFYGVQPLALIPGTPSPSMARAELTAGQRRVLREVAIDLRVNDPAVIPSGRELGDGMRKALPGLGDEEIAAVLIIVSTWLSHPADLTGCTHLRNAACLLTAVTIDFAHLEVR